ncbi:MAG: hypothetical protein WCW36_01690 [Candidatus Paceibacterota bacterium]
MKTAIILYELQQLVSLDEMLARLISQGEIPEIVSLDAEIDYALEKRGILFISGKTLQNRDAPASYLKADEITREMCDSEAMSFLKYRNVSLLKPLRLSIQIYFINFLYYVDIIASLVENHKSIKRIVVLAPSNHVSKTSSFLATYGVFVVVDAARKIAESHGIAFEMVQNVSVSERFGKKLRELIFSFKRASFGASLSILNACIALRPRRAVRIIASDYWRNIAPIMHELPEAELFLIDRSEISKIGISNVWRHKVRFVHADHFISIRARKEALRYASECLNKWLSVRADSWDTESIKFRGVLLAPLCEEVMTHLIKHAVPQVACGIASTYAMYEHLSPDVVLLRASVSEQLHFSILPLVAQSIGIPALEVQHGGEYLGPGSATRQHTAHFFAAYGPLVCDEFRALGYANDRLISAGSPRFDAYVKSRKEMATAGTFGVSILSNTPTMSIGERYGTHSVEEYYKALGEAVCTIPGARLAVASRSTSVRGGFLEEARERGLRGVPYESVGATPLRELFSKADIFICSHSTVAYEALLCRLPVIIASFAPVERMMTDFHFGHFKEAGALAIAHTPEELCEKAAELASDSVAREKMSAAGEIFMKEHFSFDGHAAERIATQIRAWAAIKG